MRQREENNPALIAIREQRGLATQIGKLLGLSRTAVWMWKRVPPEHAVAVARHLKMPVHIVCPTVFPPPRKRAEQKSTTHN